MCIIFYILTGWVIYYILLRMSVVYYSKEFIILHINTVVKNTLSGWFMVVILWPVMLLYLALLLSQLENKEM